MIGRWLAQAGDRYVEGVVWWVERMRRAPWLALVLTIAVTVAAGNYAVGTLTINTDPASLLSSDLPARRLYTEFEKVFPQFADSIVIVIDGDSPDRAEDAMFALVPALTAEKDLFKTVFAPQTDPFFRRNGLLFLDLEEVQDLSDRVARSQGLLARLAAEPTLIGLFDVLGLALTESDGDRAVGDLADTLERIAVVAETVNDGKPEPLSWIELMRGDGSDDDDLRRFIVVQPKLEFDSLMPAETAMDAIREIAGKLGLTPENGVVLRLTGSAALASEEIGSVSVGVSLASIISLVLVTALLIFGLRSIKLAVLLVVTLNIGLVWAAAFTAVSIGHLSLMSVAFAVLFIGLGDDFANAFGLRYKEEIDAGHDHVAALRVAAEGSARPLGLSALAAAAGFYSFVPTDYIGLSELGLIAGTSMFLALIATYTALPALLTLTPLRRSPPTAAPVGLERLLRRHGRLVASVAIVLGGAAFICVPQVRFDLNPINLKDPTVESVQTFLDLAKSSRNSPFTIQVLTPNVDTATRLADTLDDLTEVDSTVTVRNFVPKNQPEKITAVEEMGLFLTPILAAPPASTKSDPGMRAKALQDFRTKLAAIADSAAAQAGPLKSSVVRLAQALNRLKDDSAQIETLESALLRFFPDRLARLRESLNPVPISLPSLPASIRSHYLASDGRARVQVFPAEDLSDTIAMERFASAVTAIAPNATDSPIEIVEAGKTVAGAVRQAAITAAVLVVALLVVLLRSVREALLIMVPLVLAAAFTSATSVLFDLPFNYANVIVLPLLAGLGVSSGIHFVHREDEAGDGEALVDTSTPRAVICSALTTIGSFGSLAISTHRGTASMGELLMIAITFTLVCTLLVLPALLEWFPARTRAGGHAAKERPH
jgi:hopanoid biosynthesis associated RND transporter like protein HpnN